MIHRALSLRQPWAWLMVNGHKGVENRPRPLAYRGPLLIHASAQMTMADYLSCRLFCHSIDFNVDLLPHYDEFLVPPDGVPKLGGIVGKVEMVDCVTQAFGDHQQWFFGPYGYIFINAKPLPFFECKGMLSLMRVEVPDGYIENTPTAVSRGGAENAECDHKFIDSNCCLKCGWTPARAKEAA